MKLNSKDVETLRAILAAAKVVDVDGIVLTNGMASGARLSLDAAILTKSNLSMSEALRLGIGRVAELDKRLSVFGGSCEIEGKVNEAGDVSMLTLISGKTKMQFRCTSVALMKYPKANDDEVQAVIKMTRAEVQQVSRAVKTLAAERLTLQVKRDGNARLECVDSSNDRFDIELSNPVEFPGEIESSVNAYIASRLVDVLDAAAKDSEEITLSLGEAGSLTATAKGHTLIVFTQINGEEDDE